MKRKRQMQRNFAESMMNISLKDKIVVVTGASGALGEVACRMLHEMEAHVILLDIEEDKLQKIKADLKDKCDFFVVNLMDENSVEMVFASINQLYKRIDGLLNIAGGFTMNGKTHETKLDDFEFMVNINAKTMWLASKHALKYMHEAAHRGSIINIAAQGGVNGIANMANYSASKSMVMRYTEALAKEYKGKVRVNAILPSTIDTLQTRKDMPNADFSKWVTPTQLVSVMIFLLSDLADGITGALIPVLGESF